ncbi:OmpA family protein [Xenophilus sp. Marseille-Q4582]|uniref:OmpA family protein n=1 Tax=Xenophilus sp. Marseille-Q4582 TaxID=2866600 RepID=UPI001CE411FA|nr:OmpA family protein [Xenophilus sp. Marseille-Q4582]
MSATTDDDSQQRFALGFIFILLGLLLSTVIGAVVYRSVFAGAEEAPAPAAAALPATSVVVVTETVTAVVPEGASIQVADGVVNFYFATGSADIAPGAAEALALVIQGVESGRQARVSGFHDTTGDRALNEALAKKRAETVRDVLVGLGVPADKVRLEKPSEMTGSGSNAQARRVEVRLID